jgi:hypothetical protein
MRKDYRLSRSNRTRWTCKKNHQKAKSDVTREIDFVRNIQCALLYAMIFIDDDAIDLFISIILLRI